MGSDSSNKSNLEELRKNLILREQYEEQAKATLVSDTLKSLNLSIDALPQRCQQLLRKSVSLQRNLNLNTSNPISTSVLLSKAIATQLEEEYEILELKQDNAKLKREIERNEKFLERLREDLENSRKALNNQVINPDNVQEHIRQVKQKLASYGEVYEKAKTKFSKLQLSEGLMPQRLMELASRLAELKVEEMALKQRADDVTLAREALQKLRRT